MAVVAGVLMGLVLIAFVAGFHLGVHAHVAAVVLGVLAAAALAALAVNGGPPGWVWMAFAGDIALIGGAGVLLWRAASTTGQRPGRRLPAETGAEGVALSDLDPDGIVKVRGEQWSAVAVNAPIHRGSAVQVVGRGGLRLEVWGHSSPVLPEMPPLPEGQPSEKRDR